MVESVVHNLKIITFSWILDEISIAVYLSPETVF